MPETLGDFCTSGFYAWHSSAMHSVSPLASFKPAFSVHESSSVMEDVENSAGEVVEVPIENGVTKGDIDVRSFDPQAYKHKKA